jgi:hypothetical protein
MTPEQQAQIVAVLRMAEGIEALCHSLLSPYAQPEADPPGAAAPEDSLDAIPLTFGRRPPDPAA